MGVFALHNPKNILWFLGWRPKHQYHCTPEASKGAFVYLGLGCLNCITLKMFLGLWGGAPSTNTTVLHRPATVFLDT